ncbi:unnamed protein product [Schistosoma haematobium]|nr:unnamed protein product [Schistosoma haematobium]
MSTKFQIHNIGWQLSGLKQLCLTTDLITMIVFSSRGGRQSVFVFYTICTHFARLPENILVKTIFKHT